MAKVIEELPKRGGKKAKYPLAQWLDGQVWELTQGVDYDDYYKFRGAAYKFGGRKKLKVSIRTIDPERVAIQAVPY